VTNSVSVFLKYLSFTVVIYICWLCNERGHAACENQSKSTLRESLGLGGSCM